MNIKEAKQILKNNGYITEYTNSVANEPESMKKLLSLKKYYPDMHIEKPSDGGHSHYVFTPNDKCTAYFVYYPFNKAFRLYILYNGRDSYMDFKLSVLDEPVSKIKEFIDYVLEECGL